MTNLKAVIFDLDGTILLNEEVYEKAFRAVLEKHGVKSPIEHTPGVGMEKNWEIYKRAYNISRDTLQLSHETQDEYHKRLGDVLVRPGFFELAQDLQEEEILIGLATSNDWWLVEDELEDFDLLKYFSATVTLEEVVNPKPAPDIFWKAAEKLGFDESVCVVIEDSKAGIQAAKEAGIKSVVVLGENSKKEDFPSAKLVVEDFTKLNPLVLDELLK